MKKVFALLLSFVLFFSNINFITFAKMSTYDNLVSIDDPFIYKIKEGGVTDAQLKAYLGDLDDLIGSFKESIYMSDLDAYFITLILQVMQKERHIPILVAFDMTHQEEINYMLVNKTVPDSLNNFKLILFGDKVLVEVDKSEDITEEIIPPDDEKVATPLPFYDISSVPWCIDNIIDLYNEGIVVGTEIGKFEPDKSITREEFLKMIVKALLDVSNVDFDNYGENTMGSWYHEYYAAAEFYKLIKGIYEGDFEPEVNITRQDMTTIAYRAAIKAGINLPDKKYSTDFSDLNKMNYYAVEAIKELQEADIIHGKENNMFEPDATTTRAEAAKIVDELFKLKKTVNNLYKIK